MIRMAVQVVLIDEAEDRRDVHEIVRIDRAALGAEGLGLSLAEGKEISGGIQRFSPARRSPSDRRHSAPAPTVAAVAR
jgi:hypothetical protein